jgi:hypothetical protein
MAILSIDIERYVYERTRVVENNKNGLESGQALFRSALAAGN